MRGLIIAFACAALPVWAEDAQPAKQPQVIDAMMLSVAELMAMAAAERDGAEAHACCDWGGLGCQPQTLAARRKN